jgi:hypothetical protein
MSVEELVLQKLGALSSEQQKEVLHIGEFLAHRQTSKTSLNSIEGIWADLGVNITGKELDEAVRR